MTNHAKQRAQERYGITLSDEDISQALADIREGRSCLLSTYQGSERHIVRVQGEAIEVVHMNGYLVTVLHPQAPKKKPGGLTRQFKRKQQRARGDREWRKRKRLQKYSM